MDLVWRFVKSKWSTIDKRYSDSVLLGRLLKVIAYFLMAKNQEYYVNQNCSFYQPLFQNFTTKEDLKETEV